MIEKTTSYISYSTDIMNETELCIDDLYILPSERGRGKGKELVKQAIQYAKDNGYKTIGLYAEPQDYETDEARLIEFYHNFGFVSDPDEDKLMQMEL